MTTKTQKPTKYVMRVYNTSNGSPVGYIHPDGSIKRTLSGVLEFDSIAEAVQSDTAKRLAEVASSYTWTAKDRADCETPEEIKARTLEHARGLILATKRLIENPTSEGAASHAIRQVQLIEGSDWVPKAP